MSNKTQKNQPKETKSAPSSLSDQVKPERSPTRLLFALAIIIFGLFILVNGITGLTDNTSRLIAPGGNLDVEIVDTPEARTQGLSGRESIDEDEGMLFVFDATQSENCLIMRDMLIPIDMIWLGEDKKVITVKRNATPESYPEVFCPEAPAKYALEIKANRAEEIGIKPGEKLRF